MIKEKFSSQGITARGPRSEPRPNLHVEFPAVLTRVQAKPVDIIKEAILMNSKIDCNPIIIADRPNPKSLGRTISCLLPVDKLGQLQIWARRNNAKKLALFTESLSFWTTKKIDPTVVTPKVDSDQQVAASIITTMPVAVPITITEEPSKNNAEENAEVTDALEGAQSDSATTEMEFSDSTLAVVPISLPEESSKNNTEDLDEVTDAPQGAQGATTINTGAVKAEATKVAKAKSADKKDAYQTSLGSSIAKNRPKRACTLKRTTPAKAKSAGKKGASQTSQGSCIAKDKPRRACTLKSTSKRPSITTFLKPRVASSEGVKNDVGEPRKALIKSQLDSSVSQKLISDFFPYKDDMSRVLFDKPIVWPVTHLVPTMNQLLTGPGKK